MAEEKKEAGYSGWTNYETWCVGLWLGNSEPTFRRWKHAAEQAVRNAETEQANHKVWTLRECVKFPLADLLKNALDERVPELRGELSGMWTDLLRAALAEVNWDELAANILEGTSYDELPEA